MPVLRSMACTSCDQCFELGGGGLLLQEWCFSLTSRCLMCVQICGMDQLWPVALWVVSGWGYCCRNDVSVSPTGVWCVFRSVAWTSYGRSPCRQRARTWAWQPRSTSTTTTSTTAGVFWRGRTCSSAAAWRTLSPPSAESRRSGQWCYSRVAPPPFPTPYPTPLPPPPTLHTGFAPRWPPPTCSCCDRQGSFC